MPGNITMKRKREDQFASSANAASEGKRNCAPLEILNAEAHVDPIDLSPLTVRRNTSSSSSSSSSVPVTNTTKPTMTTTTNKILLEALAKIVELQSELDAFEHDLDESEEEQQLDAEVAQSFAVQEDKCAEAEALGFAMCARETLLFLQGEGVPSDSLLYKSLLDKLVGLNDSQLRT